MARCPRPWLLTILAVLAMLPTAAAGSLTLAPDPLPRGTPLTVHASFDEPVEEAVLRACHATGNGTVTYCLTAEPMRHDGNGTWTATTPRGFPDAGLAGANVTATTPDGTTRHLPDDGSAYAFVTLTDPAAATPAPGAPTLALALGLLAVLRRRGDR